MSTTYRDSRAEELYEKISRLLCDIPGLPWSLEVDGIAIRPDEFPKLKRLHISIEQFWEGR